MPAPCGKFLIGKCSLPAEKCKYSHNKDDSPLCTAWVRANCSGRCPKRHYYLDKDTKETSKDQNLLKGEVGFTGNEELVGVTVTKEVITKEVSTVDLVTGLTTTQTEETEYQIVDLTEVPCSPLKNNSELEDSHSDTDSSSNSETDTDNNDEEADLRDLLARRRNMKKNSKAIKIAVHNKDNAAMDVDWQALQLVESIIENHEEFNLLKEKLKNLPFMTESSLEKSVSHIFGLALKTMDNDDIKIIAKICHDMKDVKVSKNTNDEETIQFHDVLVNKCQEELEVEIGNVDLFDINALSDQMTFAHSKPEEQIVLNEFAKHENAFLKRSIAFTRLVNHLYNLDSLSPLMLHSWIKKILRNQSDKALEFLCMLMKVLGQTFEADTKVWLIALGQGGQSSEICDISVYMKELEELIQQKRTSIKVRFMLMVVLKLYKNGWKKKDTKMEKKSSGENILLNIPNEANEERIDEDGTQIYDSKEFTAVKSNDLYNAAKKQRI